MKKLFYLLILLNYFVSYSQENVYGNSPVQGIIPIKRVEIQENKVSVTRATTSNNITPSTPTGNSTEVGVTEGQLSVSLTGGATYNIPIAVPPGINGIVPQVSLSYNSQGGNGLAGYGWNISGVSVITRIPSTKFHDNTIDAVDFNSLDRFAFDGQRLLVKNGTTGIYGANGTVYETESFSNLQITSYGIHPNGADYGPAYFIVKYPDGSIAQYGSSTDSRSITDWAITYWENPQGVRISYNYVLSNNNLSISTISYGTRFTTTPINEIAFIYKTRQRLEQAYIGGQSFVRSTILSQINVKGNNVGFRNYILNHETTSLGYERLKSITEKSGDNSKSFNPTVFNYDTTTSSNLFQISNPITLNVNNIDFTNSSNISGDFDGDGNMDFILYPTTGLEAKKKYWLFTNLDGTTLNNVREYNLGTFSDIFTTSWLSWNNKLMPMQGWCAVQTNSITNTTTFNNFSKDIDNSIIFQYDRSFQFPKFTFSYWSDPCNSGGGDPYIGLKRPPIIIDPNEPVYHEIIRDIPKEFLSGDFNGDGLTDVIIIEKPVNITYFTGGCNGYNTTYSSQGGTSYFLDLDRRITLDYISIAGNLQVTSNSKFTVADVNGDGKSDLMVFDLGSIKTYYLNENKQLVQFIDFPDTSILSDKPRYLGDFNGDGKMDFVIPQAINTDNWSFFFSKGNGFKKLTTSIGVNYNVPRLLYKYGSDGVPTGLIYLEEINYVPSDYNGDGKTDIIIQTNNTIEGYGYIGNIGYDSTYGNPIDTRLKLLENKGFNELSISFEGSQISYNISNIRRSALPIFLDHNNVNQNLEYALISGNTIRTFKATKDNRKDNRLKEIILGNGVKEGITYAPLNSYCDVPYNCDVAFEPSTYIETYPNFDIKQSNGFQIVSKIEQVTASQYKQQKFKYYGAVSNVEGLSFLGFRGLSRTNWFNEDNPIISSISKHDITKRGASTETYSILGETYGNFTNSTPANFINKTNMNYVDQLLPNKVYKINNSYMLSINGLEGTSKEVTTIYDPNNNPEIITSASKNGTTIEKTEVVNIEYYPNTSSPTYILGRLKKKNSSVTHNGDTMTGEEIYTYSTAHLVSQILKKGHLTNYLTEDNIYDVFGNITQKKITAVGLTPRITNFTYDSTGRFLLSSTDIEGLVTSYNYNTSNGLLISQILPSNGGYPLITTNFYDVWGKKIKEIDYLGKSLNYSFSWLSAGTIGYFTTSTIGDDNSASVAWYDDLGRKIAEGIRTINDASLSESNTSWKTFEYDIYDRAKKTYEPKLSIFPIWEGLFSTSTFDVYGRTTQVIEHTGKSSNINYNGLTTTASDGVSNSTVVKNSFGNVVSKTDNGGTISYQYYANGNLKQSNFGGVIVAVEQDGWGRKTKLIDPSAGNYEYQYNEFGEMKKEITPKGVTTYTIDNSGKVTEKAIVGTNGDPTNTKTTFTFNPTTKLLTNTRYDDFAGGFYTLYSYGYDNFKRNNFNDESGFNAYYQRATQFDDFGRPEKELFTAVNTSDGKQSSKWIKNTYKNGNHWQILDDSTNQVLWQTSKVSARGQLTNGNYGNGVAVTNTYDQYGFPAQFKHDKTGALPVNVMTLNTVFEPQRGNLTSRYSSLFNLTENFTYDNLDRLKIYPDKSGFIKQQEYDNLGRIKSNEVGSYNYTNVDASSSIPKPFQNSSIETTPESTAYYSNRFGIFNDSMEERQAWTIYEPNVFTYDVLQSKTGTTSLKSANTTSSEKVVHSDVWTNINNEVPTQYTYSVWVKSDGTNPQAEIFLFMKTENETGYFTLVDNKISSTSNNWVLIEKTFMVPANIKKLNIRLDNNGSGNLWFDDVRIKKSSDIDNNQRLLDITYNVYKSPIDIIEEGKDKLSFIYNMNNSRSTMYYGGLDSDKLSRRFRKHYSADGSMEIKQDIVNGMVEFITYIGGDGYSAPLILKSDGTTQNYLYLHRDYLGSIVAVTNQSGTLVEKRLFDAWGNVKKIQDGAGNNLTKLTIIERGYTGHEHLQGVNLIHMNGRLYDPIIHRFLQPDNNIQDPNNTQNFNRYTYGLNNPLKYTDASGEFFWMAIAVGAIIGAASGAAAYIATSLITGNWNWGQFGLSVLTGAVIGGISGGIAQQACTITMSAFGNAAASSFVAGFMPPISIPLGDWTLSASPSIAFGNSAGAGVSFGVTYSDGDWSISGGYGIMEYSNYNGFGANSHEIRYSALVNYDDGKTGLSLGTNIWRGSAGSDGNNLNQRTGMIGFHSGDFKMMYENDGGAGINHLGLGNRGDSYRTAALNLSVGDYTAGFNLMTGKRFYSRPEDTDKYSKIDPTPKDLFGRKFPRGFVDEQGNPYRLGALTVGYKGYRVGVNSEHVRHAIQDKAIHGIIGDAGFRNYSWNWNSYFQYKSPNTFTSW